MTTVVNDKQSVLGFMLLYEGAYPHHHIQVGVVRRNGKDVRVEAIVLSKAGFEIFQLGQDEEVVRLPMQKEGLDIFVPLRGPSPVRKGPAGRLSRTEWISDLGL